MTYGAISCMDLMKPFPRRYSPLKMLLDLGAKECVHHPLTQTFASWIHLNSLQMSLSLIHQLFARPRPQPVRTQNKEWVVAPPQAAQRTPPVIPPRPENVSVKQSQGSNQQSYGTLPKVPPPRPDTMPGVHSGTLPLARARSKTDSPPVSTEEKLLITLSPPAVKKDNFDITDFDIDTLDPLHEKYEHQLPPSIACDRMDPSPVNSLHQIPARPSPSPVPDVLSQPQLHTAPVAPAAICHQQYTQQPSGTNRSNQTAVPGSSRALPAPSGAELLSQLMPKPVASPKLPRRSAETVTTTKDRTSTPTQDGSGELDLMDFTDEETWDELLTLESFDPLYSIKDTETPDTNKAPDNIEERNDSTELFPNPLDRFQRKETPNPFPAVNTVSTHNILMRSSITETSLPYKHYHRVNTGDVEKSLKVEKEVEGQGHQQKSSEDGQQLQDPFSVSELTEALERKRKKHSKEREEREAELKEKLKKEGEDREARSKLLRKGKISADTPGVTQAENVINPKRLSRGTSYIAKGQVRKISYFRIVPHQGNLIHRNPV